MNAKYPLTESLSSYARELRENKFNCTLEEFADAIGHVKSWASNLIKQQMKDVSIEDLWCLFVAEYNYELFNQKKTRMNELIEEAIENHYTVGKPTVDMMFPKGPPVEVLKGKTCLIPEDFIRKSYQSECKRIFSEDKFPEEQRYVSITFDKRYQLNKEQLHSIEELIVDRVEMIIKKYSKETLKNEYWLFALHLMFKEIEITPPIWEKIKFICFDEEYTRQNKEFKWRHIYSLLNKNKSLKNLSFYSTANAIYFDNQKEAMSEENLPSFNIKYDISEMITTGNEEDDYFELKLEDATNSKIKFIDLFMIFHYGNYVQSTKKDASDIFRKTCTDLLSYGIEVPLADLDLFLVPKLEKKELDIELLDLMVQITRFYREPDSYNPKTHTYDIKEKYKDNQALMQFRDNICACTERFINVISTDFSFINKLPTTKDELLRKEIEDVVIKFKEKNLL